MTARKAEFGTGALFKAAGTVQGVMIVGGLLVATNIFLVVSPLLVGVIGPFALLPLLLTGPSVVAACYAFNRLIAGEDTGVFRDFLGSYRNNFGQALVVGLPYQGVLAVICANLLSLPGSNPGTVAARAGLLGLGILVGTAAAHAFLLLSRFTFRTVDIHRLAAYSLGAHKRVSLGNAGILFVTGFVLLSTTAWLMLFVVGLVVYLLCLNSRPLLRLVERRFTTAREPQPAG